MRSIKTLVGIHGFSLITPLGSTLVSNAKACLQGNLTGMHVDTDWCFGKPCIIGKVTAELPKITDALAEFDYRANQFLVAAMAEIHDEIEAIKTRYPAHRIGVLLGTSTSGVDSLERYLPEFYETGQWNAAYKIHHQRMAGVAEFLAQYLDLEGPRMAISTACSSSNKAIASAKAWIENDICDAVITGGVDVLSHLTLLGFSALGALSSQQSLPFSRHRAGINIGEGTALFILENKEAQINILGAGNSSDGYHISAPDPSAQGAILAIQQALSQANVTPEIVNYINLHGTGTLQNDAMEALAISTVFSERFTTLPCSSTKPLTGHCLGASGAIELGLSVLSMMEKYNPEGHIIPHIYDGAYDEDLPKLNLAQPNNKLGRPQITLSNSFAFGGSNSCLLIGNYK